VSVIESVVEAGKRVAVEGPIAPEPTVDTPPASIVVTRTLAPGAEAERVWRYWVDEMRSLAATYFGFIGLDEMPSRPGSRNRTILYTFATPAALEEWLESPTRRMWIEKLEPHLVGATTQQEVTGLESVHRARVPKWKEVLVILSVAIPIGRLVEWVASHSAINGTSGIPRLLSTSLIGVCLMTYLAVPAAFRGLRRWLHR
jgi:antibiotic biosynthesis monooxygenase (ABM) superfamily enzyme